MSLMNKVLVLAADYQKNRDMIETLREENLKIEAELQEILEPAGKPKALREVLRPKKRKQHNPKYTPEHYEGHVLAALKDGPQYLTNLSKLAQCTPKNATKALKSLMARGVVHTTVDGWKLT